MKKPRYWVIKTTEGGPGHTDHWEDFQKERVVAVGWREIRVDPSRFSNVDQYKEAVASKHNRPDHYPSSTLYTFAHDWNPRDKAIICTGYAPNQSKDVHVYGIAEVGEFYFEKDSKWWRAKRKAHINPMEKDVPVTLFKRIFGGSMLRTLHGPFSTEQFNTFAKAIGAPTNKNSAPSEKIPDKQTDLRLPEEVAPTDDLYEGVMSQIWVNAYERNPAARHQCRGLLRIDGQRIG